MEKMKFGKRIRMIRQNSGYTQKEFCSLLGIPQSTLSAYETDRMQPTVDSLINIATKFNVSMDWLCGIKIKKETEQKIHDSDNESSDELSDGELLTDLESTLADAKKILQELQSKRNPEEQRAFKQMLEKKKRKQGA